MFYARLGFPRFRLSVQLQPVRVSAAVASGDLYKVWKKIMYNYVRARRIIIP
jgi:hypothetical protein